MNWPDVNYFVNIAREYAIGMESYPEDNEEHKKNIFIALLKFSCQSWYLITSNEDFQEIKNIFQTLVEESWIPNVFQTIVEKIWLKLWLKPEKKIFLDSKDKLILKQLEQDIEKYYPKMWAESLHKRQSNAQKEHSDTYEAALEVLKTETNRLIEENLKAKNALTQQQLNEKTSFEKIRKVEMKA